MTRSHWKLARRPETCLVHAGRKLSKLKPQTHPVPRRAASLVQFGQIFGPVLTKALSEERESSGPRVDFVRKLCPPGRAPEEAQDG